MKTIIGFYLRRRFLNKTAIILNAVIFLALGLVFHLDKIMAGKEELPVYLDASCSSVADKLMDMDRIYIVSVEDLDEYHTLHYEDGWILQICKGDGHGVSEKVENDLRKIRKDRYLQGADLKTREFLERYSADFTVELQDHSTFDVNTIVISIVFYLVLTYSNMIANELVYEKASHTLGMLISLVGERVHFVSKIRTAYLSLMIQGLSVLVSFLIWLFVRFQEDHLRGLLKYLDSSEVTAGISLSRDKALLILFIVVAGLLLVQIIMLIITSLLKNSEEVATFQNIYYILLIIIYYVFIMKNQTDITVGGIRSLLSYVPVFSMLIMPVRLISSTASMVEGMISLIITITVTVITAEAYLSGYRRILLK